MVGIRGSRVRGGGGLGVRGSRGGGVKVLVGSRGGGG